MNLCFGVLGLKAACSIFGLFVLWFVSLKIFFSFLFGSYTLATGKEKTIVFFPLFFVPVLVSCEL